VFHSDPESPENRCDLALEVSPLVVRPVCHDVLFVPLTRGFSRLTMPPAAVGCKPMSRLRGLKSDALDDIKNQVK
jgi:hypothetical protein